MPFSELNRTAPQDLIEFAGHHIGNILADVPGVEFVMACSADGFKLASADKKSAGNSGARRCQQFYFSDGAGIYG
ncbi:MAG: hypothetical protein WB445_04845 [Acinetobacter sp.]